MKLPIAFATVLLAATTALPAFAANAAPRDAVQYQQDYRSGFNADYRSGINAYAASPRPPNATRRPPPGDIASAVLKSGARSAFPSWDVCRPG